MLVGWAVLLSVRKMRSGSLISLLAVWTCMYYQATGTVACILSVWSVERFKNSHRVGCLANWLQCIAF